MTFQHIPTNPSGETAKEIIVVETLPPELVFDVLDRHVPRGNPCSPRSQGVAPGFPVV